MELVYMYIQSFDEIIVEEEINFSNNFCVNMNEKKELIIKDKENNFNSFYGENIKNITMLLGKNGSGKTSILDILGMKSDDRINNYKRNKNNSYFILYSIGNNEFLLEYVGVGILRQISNIHSKFRNYIDHQFDIFGIERIKKYGDKLIIDLDVESRKVAEKIKTSYILNDSNSRIQIKYKQNESEIKNNRISHFYKLCNGKLDEYNYIKNLNDKVVKSSNVRLSIECNIPEINTMEFGSNLSHSLKEQELFNMFKSNLYNNYNPKFSLYMSKKVEQKIGKTILNKANYDNKQIFILDLLCKYIVNEFYNKIYNRLKSNTSDIEKDNNEISKITDEELDSLLKYCCSKNFDYTSLDSLIAVDIMEELEMINKAVKFFREKGRDKIEELTYLLRYLNSRIFTVESFYSNDYFKYIDTVIKKIQSIDISYFNEDEISIGVNVDDKDIESFLKTFDQYSPATNPASVVRIENILKLKFKNLSQGENYYFSLYSKLYDILKDSNKDELTVLLLDEPDQSLHPDWSRCFINNIVNESKKYNMNLQIVITTHSPFMVSDIIKDNVYLLNKDLEIGKSYINNINEEAKIHNTFASNIYEVLKMSFFLDKTMGEFSYNKIVEWIEKIERRDTSDNNLKESLELIGEKIIRNKLQVLYKEKYCIDEEKSKLIKLIELEQDSKKIQEIVKILAE